MDGPVNRKFHRLAFRAFFHLPVHNWLHRRMKKCPDRKGSVFMGVCKKCGTNIWPGVQICPSCGAAVDNEKSAGRGRTVPIGKWGADRTAQFDSGDIAENKAAATLSYFGLLVAVPLFMAKGSKYARWHAGQGLALLAASVIYSIAYSVLAGLLLSVSWEFYYALRIIRLAWLAFPLLSVLGAANAINGKAAELPVIGKIRLLKGC